MGWGRGWGRDDEAARVRHDRIGQGLGLGQSFASRTWEVGRGIWLGGETR